MSGPIVRKYGFPNFDKIFGAKPILHGVDDDPKPEASSEQPPADSAAKTDTPAEPPTEERRASS
ncbi:hypothetical protein [Tautonia marina]|uniref:hypothetical protein n=1 Tax=Tautonia marina TaxID=2653855 RepID=UPI001260BA53|nr:hypothetical protein [Tautonia marina]